MKDKQKLYVAYSADDNYAKYLGISMISLFQTNKVFNEIVIFVLDCGIGDINKEKLMTIASDYNRNIQFLSMKEYMDKLELNMGSRKISIASYARLFLSSVIPKHCNKVIYLDCDTIILDELTKLWNLELKDYMLAGVRDTVDKYFLRKIGLNTDDYYVNAGIILINLDKWRATNIQQKFIDFIEEYKGNVPHHDQGTINAVCNKKILIASPVCNVTSNIYSFSAKTIRRIYFMNSFYSQEELDEAKKNPVIIHYTTGLVGRPWEDKCTHPRREDYIKAALESPWKDDNLLPDSRGFMVKAFAFLYRYTPGFLSETAYRISSWFSHIKK